MFLPVGLQAKADGERASGVGAGPSADDGDQAVRVIPAQDHVVDLQQLPGLVGDRGEHLVRRRPRATSVATRRSAACSSAKPRSSVRACALAIAVAASPVNPTSRASVSAGSGCADLEITA